MDLARGLQIEDPATFVPWGASVEDVRSLVPSAQEVTSAYLVAADVVSLSGLRHMLGFHFDAPSDGRLVELEFFRRSYPDQKASFEEFQRHLEATFGPPHETEGGDEGELPWYRWSIAGATIRHYIIDRFGPEEHVRIRRESPPATHNAQESRD